MKYTNIFYLIASAMTGLCIANANAARADEYCDNLCSKITSSNNSLDGKGNPWGQADDAWCASNGYAPPTPAAGGEKRRMDTTSMAQVTPAYGNLPPTDALIAQCQFHGNSQAMDQCLAYQAAHGAQGSEKMLAALDMVATGTCGMACAAKTFSPGIQKMCSIAGKTVTVGEILQTFILKHDGAGAKVNGILAAAKLAMGEKGIGAALEAEKLLNEKTITLNNAIDNPTEENRSKYDQAYNKAPDQNGVEVAHKKAKNEACQATVFFAIMSATRAANIGAQSQARSKTCENIKNLQGNQAVAGLSVNAPGRGGNTAAGGGKGGSNAGSGPATNLAENQLACIQSQSISACGSTAQASSAEAGVLDTSGLSKHLAPQAADLLKNLDVAAKNQGSGGGGGGALGGALSGLPANMKASLLDLAAMTDMGNGNVAGGVYSGGGGGSHSGGGSSSELSFPGLFGAAASGSGSGTGPMLSFKEASAGENDIFHSNSNLSLFQIVSKKLTKVNDRLDRLDWSTPLNRALAGLPQKK